MNKTPVVNSRAASHFDKTLTLLTYALAIFGVVAVTAATYSYSEEALSVSTIFARITNSYYGTRQGLFLIISPLVIAAMMLINYRIFKLVAFPLYIASLVLLAAVLVLGNTTSGVTGWFELFSGYMLQPSEFAKIGSILLLAKFFSSKDDPVTTFQDFLWMGVIMVVPAALILWQGELGTVMVFIAIYLGMMFMSGMKLRIIGGILIAGVAVLIPIIMYMESSGSYRFDRLLAFFDPSRASSDATYQSTNSLIAIGNGGLTGTGMFVDGTYTSLKYVPQNHTDFIFSSIGETMGFVGCVLVIVLYALLLLRMLSLAKNTYDKFGRLVIIGVFTMLFFHIVYNIGMTTGVAPVMGIPLPFLSYGGSNLTANMASIGLVLNVTFHKEGLRSTPIETAEPHIPKPRHAASGYVAPPRRTGPRV